VSTALAVDPGYPVRMHLPRLAGGVPLATLALVLAGCVAGTSPAPSPAPPSSAPPSDSSAACPTAPAPNPPDPAGWPTPGTAVKASVYPVIVSSEQICGHNRLLFSFLDASNQPVASPDRTASVAFYDLGRDPATPVSRSDGTFLWAIEGSRGVYVTSADFPEAGEWGAEFTTAVAGGVPETVRMRFEVKPTGTPVPVGARAPASVTPTAADVGGDLGKLSSDQHPDPSFYQLSVDQALAQGKPFALIFATPAFCTSAQCGPTLDLVKGVAKDEPGFTFINVEPYKLTYANGSLQPELDANGQLQPVKAVIDYGLLSEPWIFVVDRNGLVSASFEAIISPEELKAAIDAVK
jgi:hypothetical protein